MKIKKKTWTDSFEAILSGRKNFDARLSDFDCKTGDILVLEEYDPINKSYTGRIIEKEITYVLDTNKQKYWNKSDIAKTGLKIISFK